MPRSETVANADSHLPAPVSRGRLEYAQMAGRMPSYRLTFDDAVEVWLRHFDGEFQNRIAATFDVNQGRVNDVLKARIHVGSKDAALKKKAA